MNRRLWVTSWFFLAAMCIQLTLGDSIASAQQWVQREMIHGYTEVYSVSEQGPVYLYVWFKGFPPSLASARTLERVTFDFGGRQVYFDPSQRVEVITNNFVRHASFFSTDDPQVFGFDARRFASRGTVILKLDLDRGPTLDENPFTKDFLEGTATFHFNGRLEIVATYSEQGSFGPRTAKAEFFWISPWISPKQAVCIQAPNSCRHTTRCCRTCRSGLRARRMRR